MTRGKRIMSVRQFCLSKTVEDLFVIIALWSLSRLLRIYDVTTSFVPPLRSQFLPLINSSFSSFASSSLLHVEAATAVHVDCDA